MATNYQSNSLIDYGIQNEKSDYRLHVCVLARRLYLYATSDGLKAIETGRYQKRSAKTGNTITAIGYLIPPDHIYDCKLIMLPDDIWQQYPINDSDLPSKKGRLAAMIAKAGMERGYMALPMKVEIVTSTNEQIDGADLRVKMSAATIQVKCDYRGGHKQFNSECTGNLFLQIAEANPAKSY